MNEYLKSNLNVILGYPGVAKYFDLTAQHLDSTAEECLLKYLNSIMGRYGSRFYSEYGMDLTQYPKEILMCIIIKFLSSDMCKDCKEAAREFRFSVLKKKMLLEIGNVPETFTMAGIAEVYLQYESDRIRMSNANVNTNKPIQEKYANKLRKQ